MFQIIAGIVAYQIGSAPRILSETVKNAIKSELKMDSLKKWSQQMPTNAELATILSETLEIWQSSDCLYNNEAESIIMKFGKGLESIDTQKESAIIFLALQTLKGLKGGHLSANDEDDIMEEFSKRLKMIPTERPFVEEKILAFEIIELLMANYHKLSQKNLEIVLRELKSRIS